MVSLVGETLNNRYLITAVLGKQRGRRTFLATDLSANGETNSQVVLKLVLFGPDFSWQDLKLFEREAQTLQSLNHPAIPKYLESFEVDTALGNGFVLVQTYLEAKSLQDWISSGYTFQEKELSAIATNLLNILTYLHQQNPPVIHRDIKPSNILFLGNSTLENSVYLVDFGSVQTAATTGTMTVVGTYGYMPPEQFGGRAQPASDLYSLGATLIYLATGQHPADLTQQSLAANSQVSDRTGNAALNHLSPNFRHWIAQLMQTDLAQRIPSAQEALAQLNAPHELAPISTADLSFNSLSNPSLVFQSEHRDFKAFSDEQVLEVQFSPRRLLINPDFVMPQIAAHAPNLFVRTVGVAAITLIAMALVAATLYTLILLSVAMIMSNAPPIAWVAIVGILLAAGLHARERLKARRKKAIKTHRVSSLNIKRQDEGPLLLTIFIETYQGKIKQHFEFCSNLPIASISAGKNESTVIFSGMESNRKRSVYLESDRDDTRWIFSLLNHWQRSQTKMASYTGKQT